MAKETRSNINLLLNSRNIDQIFGSSVYYAFTEGTVSTKGTLLKMDLNGNEQLNSGFGSGGDLVFKGFRIIDNYIYAYGHGKAVDFLIDSSPVTFLMKTHSDFSDTSCSKLAIETLPTMFNDIGALTLVGSASITGVDITSAAPTLVQTLALSSVTPKTAVLCSFDV